MNKILYIEDDEEDFMLLSESLSEDYIIEWASDYDSAIKILNEKKYDVILLDFYLKTVTGLTILEYIRKKDKDTPVIMLTSNSDRSSDIKAMELGADDYILKHEMTKSSIDRKLRYAINKNNESKHKKNEIVNKLKSIKMMTI